MLLNADIDPSVKKFAIKGKGFAMKRSDDPFYGFEGFPTKGSPVTTLPSELIDVKGAEVLVDEIKILGFRMNPVTGGQVVVAVADAVADSRRLVMANINLHAMNAMYDSPAMTRLLSQQDAIVMIDSMPLLFLAKLTGARISRKQRTTSLDFYDDLFKLGAAQHWRFGYVGADEATLRDGLNKLRERFPGLSIDGHHGFFDIHDDAPGSTQSKIIEWLNVRNHDVVIVGMGMPLQEEWIALTQSRVPTRVFLPAGAYLDYQVGVQTPAPRWIGQIGLEWCYRLALSPRRLSYRYLVEPLVLASRLIWRPHPQARAKDIA